MHVDKDDRAVIPIWDGSQNRKMPTRKASDMGLFFVKETSLINPNGSIRITKTTKVTDKVRFILSISFKKDCCVRAYIKKELQKQPK